MNTRVLDTEAQNENVCVFTKTFHWSSSLSRRGWCEFTLIGRGFLIICLQAWCGHSIIFSVIEDFCNLKDKMLSYLRHVKLIASALKFSCTTYFWNIYVSINQSKTITKMAQLSFTVSSIGASLFFYVFSLFQLLDQLSLSLPHDNKLSMLL